MVRIHSAPAGTHANHRFLSDAAYHCSGLTGAACSKLTSTKGSLKVLGPIGLEVTAMTLLGADRSEQCRFQRASVIAAGNVRPRRRQLRSKWPKLATLIDDSETDVLSYLYFHEPDQFVRYGGRLQKNCSIVITKRQAKRKKKLGALQLSWSALKCGRIINRAADVLLRSPPSILATQQSCR